MNITIGETHPWGSAEIAWINDPSRIDYRANLKQQVINQKNTHLHRQVSTERSGQIIKNQNDVLEILHDAYDQFDLLRTIGIKVPEVDFHVIPGPKTHPWRIKTLARVEIIDGKPIDESVDTNYTAEIDDMIYRYYQQARPDKRLQDISSASQYILGTSRHGVDTLPMLTLVDIEPTF